MSALSEEAQELLADSLSGCLGMADEEGPYVVPISFALRDSVVYFHGGEGRKAEALDKDPRVCLSVTSTPELVRGQDPCSDNFDYRSVLIFGRAKLLTDAAEREAGLRALAGKYHESAEDTPFREATLRRTRVYALRVERVTWKQHPKS